jgi:hypothetical protein
LQRLERVPQISQRPASKPEKNISILSDEYLFDFKKLHPVTVATLHRKQFDINAQ